MWRCESDAPVTFAIANLFNWQNDHVELIREQFGELRSLLQGPPAQQTWQNLCAMLEQWDEETFGEVALSYALDPLRRWDDAIRRAPRKWLDRARAGKPPIFLRLARSVDLHQSGISDDELSALARIPAMRHIRWLDVSRNWVRADGARQIIAAGGDGTVHEVIDGLYDPDDPTEIPFGLLPLGTGNDLARSLRLPDTLLDIIELIEREEHRPLDLIEVSPSSLKGCGKGRCFAVNAANGGNAELTHEIVDDEIKQRFGALAYLIAAIRALAELESGVVESGE